MVVKFAVVAPEPTTTLAGTCATALLLDSVTLAPPAGAGALKVTVPEEDVPPSTLVGLSTAEETVALLT